MRIHKKTEAPVRDGNEEFSVTVLTYNEEYGSNLGFYNFDFEGWLFHIEDPDRYADTDFVWIYLPEKEMKKFLIKSSKEEHESTTPSSKRSWYQIKTKHIKKKITLAFKKK